MPRIILFADDDESIRKSHKFFFEMNFPEYDVEFFRDGTSLNKRLNQDLTGVCAVVTDNRMPGIEGSGIIKDYARRLRHIPFILSYGGDKEIGEEAVRAGAYAYVLKTDNPRLYEVLKRVLNRQN